MVKETADEVVFDIVFNDVEDTRPTAWWKKLPIINMFVRYEHDLSSSSDGEKNACTEGERICSC